jgi:hypothetical protein
VSREHPRFDYGKLKDDLDKFRYDVIAHKAG